MDDQFDSSFGVCNHDDSFMRETSELMDKVEKKLPQYKPPRKVVKLSPPKCALNTSIMETSFLTPLMSSPLSHSLIDQVKEKLKENTRRSLNLSLTPHQVEEAQNDASFFGLPAIVKHLLNVHRGISELYEWQKECLSLPALNERKNLIYSLPTSGGKTLVAEILAFKEIICNQKNVLFVLPYVSIVQEKVRGLSGFGVDLGFLVEEYAGSRGQIPPTKRRRRCAVYIATIEKAHFLVNSLIELKRLDEIGLVIVDELHMLGDGSSRGATLETALVKIKRLSHAHIIGMSATLGNMSDLKNFLDADDFVGSFRPVELKEYVKLERTIFEFAPKEEKPIRPVRKLSCDDSNAQMKQQDPELLTVLVREVIPKNSCLVFCPTKKNCENVALLLTKFLPCELKEHKKAEKLALLRALETETGHVCSVLRKTIPSSVAYHHSGLTTEERRLVEEAYSLGVLSCLACTSTLAAGVNLPAKRVILKSPYTGTEFLTRSVYQQMVGRAGRAGIDSSGESILIIRKGEEDKVLQLLQSPVGSCQSGLLKDEGRGLDVLLLSLVGLKIAESIADVESFVSGTLMALQLKEQDKDIADVVQESVNRLCSAGLLQCTKAGQLQSTSLGRGCFRGCMEPAMAVPVYEDLKVALRHLALQCHLHLLYLITPRKLSVGSLDPPSYYRIYTALNKEELQVAEAVGVTECLVTRLASGRLLKAEETSLLSRFYLTMQLNDLWNQQSIWKVAERFNEQRGNVQTLLVSAAASASAIHHFCEEFPEFWAYRDLMPSFVQRLSHCVTAELIPLMELPSVKRGRARQLYQAGFKTLVLIARAEAKDLVDKIDHMPRKVASQIISAAKLILLKKAEDLQEEAEDMVEGLAT
ncbi:helicase POLQ-like [Ornithodoros turicata]|uniref:helicase POLQ-like n=1 Tax=Ornithodoros turicata TaxID=34597 RepID=UPI0031388E13